MTKYIFVTGGVLSSLGKGITSASIATLLKHSGLNVSMVKIDPYLNVDPGTMSPLEHGEVFVTKDGAETDLDLGNYERFLNVSLSQKNSMTTGQIYSTVIERERRGEYLGKTIQVVPHIVDEIKKRIQTAGRGFDVLVVELGGTVGDIEGLPFYEAVRQMRHAFGNSRVFNVHVTLVPYIKVAHELKTKPTQHSVQELRRIGITPHMLVCRSEKPIGKEIKHKLSNACDVDFESVIEASDAKTIYEIPLKFLQDGILKPISKQLELGDLKPDMKEWKKLTKSIIEPTNSVKIAFVGKYQSQESYKSLLEALIHAGAWTDSKVEIDWIDSETITAENVDKKLSSADGILVPGGFGHRGVNGKLEAIKYARINKKVFLGICLGMQLSVIDYARNVLGIKDADSQEFAPDTKNPVIYLIDEFIDQSGSKQIRTHTSPLGGTMRLGEYECNIKENTKLFEAYGEKKIFERHRHRYEGNSQKYKELLINAGMIISGESKGLMEAIELKDHPWFVAVQFHPEFTSRLQNPNKIILAFIQNVLKNKN
ncbi:MAG: synthase [Campylobacterota bacterium]|nr:synthase [Campylobacterota bacterium]